MAEGPHLGSVRPGRWLGITLYVLLGIAAAAALAGGSNRFAGIGINRLGTIAFGVFVIVFAIYRFTLVRAGRYSLGKSLYQVGASLLLLVVLGYGTFGVRGPEASGDGIGYLLRSADPHVRRAGCELARWRRDLSVLHDVRELTHDDDPEVTSECRRAQAALEAGGGAGQ